MSFADALILSVVQENFKFNFVCCPGELQEDRQVGGEGPLLPLRGEQRKGGKTQKSSSLQRPK